MARSPQTGIRNVKLVIKDGSATVKSRTLLCHSALIPQPTTPEMIKVKPEHQLVAVIPGADVESTLAFSIGVESFLDATQPTVAEIMTLSGAGANWTPINAQLANVHIPATDAAGRPLLPVFTFEFHLDDRRAGGSYTVRTVQAHVKPDPAFDRADPMVIAFSGEVFGTIVDTVGA